MKKLRFKLLAVTIATLFFIGCSNDDTSIDKEKPSIDISKSAFQNCTKVVKGEPFAFTAEVTDNEALGSYSFDIHHNFDHHTHSTESAVTECMMDKKKEATNPFKLVKTFSIPNNPKTYTIQQEFTIPTEYEAGDYHFMVKVVDKSGWASLKGLSFKVVEK